MILTGASDLWEQTIKLFDEYRLFEKKNNSLTI